MTHYEVTVVEEVSYVLRVEAASIEEAAHGAVALVEEGSAKDVADIVGVSQPIVEEARELREVTSHAQRGSEVR